MIFNEVFNDCYNMLTGTFSNVRETSRKRRYNRALLALRSQNHFLGVSFTNESGAAGVTSVQRTAALERRLIIRGGGMNTYFIGGDGTHFDVPSGGAVNVKIQRSGTSRAQISKETIRNTHYFSAGEGQKWELDWPVPWVLEPNEIILCNFTQISAVDADTIYALNFYGVTVDPKIRCDELMLRDIEDQILNEPIQKPRYIHVKSNKGSGSISFSAIGTNERAVASTIEVPEHMLVLGWRRYMIGAGPDAGPAAACTMRLAVNGGPAFSRLELPVNGFEYFNTPDAGFFRLAIPHFIPKGSSIGLTITGNPTRLIDQFEGELELLCVTV